MRKKSPRQELNPHLGRTKGACLPLTLRRPETWRWSESNRHPPRCKRGARPVELHPQRTKCGRVESNHHSQGRQGYSLLSSPLLSVRRRCLFNIEGRPTGLEPALRGSRPRVLAVTPQPPRTNGDDRVRTGGLSPDKRVLCLLSYAPEEHGAGGIRTHGLELMRLARTATPLPRSVCHLDLAGRSRTCGLLRPKQAGWPTPPQPVDEHSQLTNRAS